MVAMELKLGTGTLLHVISVEIALRREQACHEGM